jgi:hypothetical protein
VTGIRYSASEVSAFEGFHPGGPLDLPHYWYVLRDGCAWQLWGTEEEAAQSAAEMNRVRAERAA